MWVHKMAPRARLNILLMEKGHVAGGLTALPVIIPGGHTNVIKSKLWYLHHRKIYMDMIHVPQYDNLRQKISLSLSQLFKISAC